MAIDIIARGMIEESSGDVGQLSEKVNSHMDNSDIHVTTADKSNWNSKFDSNQGAANAGKLLGTNSSGDVVAIQGYGFEYNEETKMLEYGTDPTTNLNQGIGLDDSLSKKGFAADSAAVGELKQDLDKDNKTIFKALDTLGLKVLESFNKLKCKNESKAINDIKYAKIFDGAEKWCFDVGELEYTIDGLITFSLWFNETNITEHALIHLYDTTNTLVGTFNPTTANLASITYPKGTKVVVSIANPEYLEQVFTGLTIYKNYSVQTITIDHYIPFENEYKSYAFNGGGNINSSNYNEYFTNANNAPINKSYLIETSITSDMISNLPSYGVIGNIITISWLPIIHEIDDSSFEIQLYASLNHLYYRYHNSVIENEGWTDWIDLIDNSTSKYNLLTVCDKPFDFNGKTLYAFGDSIVVGQSIQKPYIDKFAEYNNMLLNKYAIGGEAFVKTDTHGSILEQLQRVNLNDADFLYLAGGTNDSGNVEIYHAYEFETFETNLKATFEYIKNNYNGTVIIATPINFNGSMFGDSSDRLNRYRDRITFWALHYGFNIIDGSSVGLPTGLSEEDALYYYLDGGHPTQFGHDMIYRALKNYLL